ASTDPETGEPTFEINIGHPKDGRWDLNRFTLSLISNADGVPLFMKTYSGNASDHETLKESMVKLQSALRETLSDEKKIFFIADAAFYTSDNIKDFKASWITRVPATLSESAMLLHQDVELVKGEQDERYSFYETSSEYGGVAQKWVLIHSQEMEEKQARTFEKRLEKQMTKGRAALTHLKNFEFACEADARAQAKKWISSYPLLEFAELRVRIEKRRASGRKGRPQKGEELKEVFFVEAELRENAEGLERERRSLGRFILASNDTSLSG
ncbi:MAG: IS1634 family transposase, partial [Synergistaceae bacterium]|nr:IS1634 family transposase [Synergistaceae bacterium]